MALLVLDEGIASPKLASALEERGIVTTTVGALGVTGRTDPEVVRRIDGSVPPPWVLVTMDLTIMEDHRGFSWERYALAWIIVNDALRGAQVEREKVNVVHRHAHVMCEQTRGDHHSYTAKQHFKHPPSLTSLLRRRS